MTQPRTFYNSSIPNDWSDPEFGSVFSFLKTFPYSREELTNRNTDSEIHNIHYGDIHATYADGILDFESEENVPFLKDGLMNPNVFDEEEFPSLQDGDLVIADASEDYEGLCDCVELRNVGNRKVIAGLHTFAARGDKKKAVEGFRTYSLRHEQVIRQLRRLATGISVLGVSKANLSRVKIPLPPLAEQRAIAHVLGLVDRAIELNNKIIAQKDLRKKWLMQNLLTGKKRLKGFTGEWKEVQIGELLEPIYRYVEWSDDHVYRLVSIRRRYRGITQRGDFQGHQIEVKKVKTIKQNDFLISKRQVSHGAWALVSKDFHGFSVSDEYDCLTLRDVKKLDMGFWGWFCQNPQMTHYAYLASNGVHIEKLIFDYDTFKKRRVAIPVELAEQQQIASALTSADTELFLLARKTDQLREKKKWLMQQLLTGKRRIQILDE